MHVVLIAMEAYAVLHSETESEVWTACDSFIGLIYRHMR